VFSTAWKRKGKEEMSLEKQEYLSEKQKNINAPTGRGGKIFSKNACSVSIARKRRSLTWEREHPSLSENLGLGRGSLRVQETVPPHSLHTKEGRRRAKGPTYLAKSGSKLGGLDETD